MFFRIFALFMTAFKRILAIVLATVVFVSSGGVVLAVHICSKNSSKEVSFFSNETCCSKKTSCSNSDFQKILKKNCCNLKITYHKVDISSINSEVAPLPIHVIDVSHFNFENAFVQQVILKSVLTNKAPPFFTGGKSFLAISENYLI